MSDVFISYSRIDIAFARLIQEALQQSKVDTWIDWLRIPVGEKWWPEICEAIQNANVFMFIISKNSIDSSVCKDEINLALQNHKRIIPIIVDSLKPDVIREFAPDLPQLNWIIFERDQIFRIEENPEVKTDKPEDSQVALPKLPQFVEALERLNKAIHTNWEWVKYHTRLQVSALLWESNQRNPSYLVRGTALEEAEQQLLGAAGKDPQPTVLQAEFVTASRKEETQRQEEKLRLEQKARQRQRLVIWAVGIGLVVAIVLGVVAWGQRNQYLGETHVRATAESNAVNEAHTAATAEADAVSKEQARATAQAQAENQAQLALSGKLAANALTLQGSQFDLSMLLAVRSYDTAANIQSLQGLMASLDYSPRLAHILPAQGKTGMSRLLNGGKTTMALSPDGKILAVVDCAALDENALFCASTEVRMWDTATWQPIGSPIITPAGESPIDAITFSQQGNELVLVTVAIQPLLVGIWQVSDQTRLSSFIPKKSEDDQPISAPVFSLAFSQDGRRIAVGSCPTYSGNPIEGCGKAEIRLVDVTTQKELAHSDVTAIDEILKTTSVPATLAFSPDSTRLAYNSYPGKIVILDANTGKPVGKSLAFGSGYNTPSALAFSPDGKTLAASGCGLTGSGTSYCLEGVINFYDLEKGILTGNALHGHSDSTTLLAYSSDGKKLISGSSDRTLWLWDPINRVPLSGALRGHNKSLTSLVVSPDGGHTYSLDTSGQVIAWDIGETTSLVRSLEGGADTSFEAVVAVSPDGRLAAAATGKSQVIVWDAQTGKQVVQPFNTQEFFQNALAFSADGKSLLTSSGDHPLERWDLAAGATNPTSLLVNLGGSGYAHTIAGGRLFIISNDQEKTLTLMDVSTDLPVGKPVSDSSLPGKVFASTPDASLLAIGGCVQPGKTGKDCTQGEIQLVHLPDWTPAGEPLRGHAAAVTSLALSADGKTLISSAEDGTLLVWTLGSPAASHSIDTTHSGLEAGFYFNQLSISNDGRLLAASAFAPSMTAFYETTSGKYLGNTGDLPGWCSWNTTTFDPDGRLFTSGDCGGGFYLVTGVSTGQPVTRTIKDSGDAVMAFSPDGKTFASAGTSISLWTVEGEVLTKGKTLSGCERKIHGMAFSPDGKTLGVLYDDFTVELWDPISGTLLARPYFGALYNPIAPAFNRNATLMAGGICVKRDKGNSCLQSEIHFWDTATGKESGQPILMAATARIDALAFSPDGRWLASADCLTDLTGLNATNLCTQEEVRLWDVTGRKSFGSVLTGLIYDKVNLAFSPQGNLLAGGDSKQVVLWETASGKQHTAPTPLLNGSGLAFRPDGSLLLVGTGNGIILIDPESGRIIGQSTQANADQIAFNASGTMLFSRTAAWQFDPSVWRARLCSQAGRDLTQTEWADYLPGLAYQETCVP